MEKANEIIEQLTKLSNEEVDKVKKYCEKEQEFRQINHEDIEVEVAKIVEDSDHFTIWVFNRKTRELIGSRHFNIEGKKIIPFTMPENKYNKAKITFTEGVERK